MFEIVAFTLFIVVAFWLGSLEGRIRATCDVMTDLIHSFDELAKWIHVLKNMCEGEEADEDSEPTE